MREDFLRNIVPEHCSTLIFLKALSSIEVVNKISKKVETINKVKGLAERGNQIIQFLSILLYKLYIISQIFRAPLGSKIQERGRSSLPLLLGEDEIERRRTYG
jgi:hypothetical protein